MRSIRGRHDEYEVIAQATCTSIAIAKGQNSWTYAVRRFCSQNHLDNCQDLCTASPLVNYDHQTKSHRWTSIGALHVYTHQPPSTPSTVNEPSIGLKVLWVPDYEIQPHCGPNFCCCAALI